MFCEQIWNFLAPPPSHNYFQLSWMHILSELVNSGIKWFLILKHLIWDFCRKNFQCLPHSSAVNRPIFKSNTKIHIIRISVKHNRRKNGEKVGDSGMNATRREKEFRMTVIIMCKTVSDQSLLCCFRSQKYLEWLVSIWGPCRIILWSWKDQSWQSVCRK